MSKNTIDNWIRKRILIFLNLVPYEAFTHQVMGKSPGTGEGISGEDVKKISISISDKVTTPFALELEKLGSY